jgi:chloramphenicol 3-O phosphotransferase
MEAGKIVLINGASSSGKTSIVHALQDILEEPYLKAGIDKFIFMMPKRYLERPLWDDVLGLADRAGDTGHTLVGGMHRAIRALSLAGCNVIADHVLVEPAWVKDCVDCFADLRAYIIGVQCPLDVLEMRERSRKTRTLGQAKAQYEVIHKYCRYDLEVDTSALTPGECAERIRARMAEPPEAISQMRNNPQERGFS